MQEIYLSNMGIQIWHTRLALPGAKQIISVIHTVLFKCEQAVGDLIITSYGDEIKVNKLLSAMLLAIGLKSGELSFVNDLDSYDISGCIGNELIYEAAVAADNTYMTKFYSHSKN